METVWDEIRTILGDLIEIAHMSEAPSEMQVIRVVHKHLKRKLNDMDGRFFAEEDPNYQKLILNIKDAKKEIARFKKKKKVKLIFILDAVFRVMEQLTILQAGVK